MRKQETIKLHSNMPMVVYEANEKGEIVKAEKQFDFGRDTDKTFRLTEMSAMQLEKWHIKMLALMKDSFAKAAEDVMDIYKEHSATLAFASLANKSVGDAEKYIDLLNEHLYCYEFFNKERGEYIKLNAENVNDYIEELTSLRYLRDRAAQFNIADFMKGNPSSSQN